MIKAPTMKDYLSVAISTAANGKSAAVDLGGHTLCSVSMSTAGWTNATLTFEGSVDGTKFGPVYGSTGNQITLTTTASRHVAVNPDNFRGLRHLKLVSSVAQSTDRTLLLGLDTLSAIK